MFGLVAALYSLSEQREDRKALNYENCVHTRQYLPSSKIYRESSVDKRARKEIAVIRCKERLKQQIKYVRLMKKLLIKIDRETFNEEVDEQLEKMRDKVVQLELKVGKAAIAKDIDCEDMFNMEKPDDAYDTELEQTIRGSTRNITNIENIYSKAVKQTSNVVNEKLQQIGKECGDSATTEIFHLSKDNGHSYGDQLLVERPRRIK